MTMAPLRGLLLRLLRLLRRLLRSLLFGCPPASRAGAWRSDFLLEFEADVDPAGIVVDLTGRHAEAAALLRTLPEIGVEVRQVRSLRDGCSAYALRGRYERLLRLAERHKLRKPLRTGAGRTAPFTMARVVDFRKADSASQFFSSGERIMLLERHLMECGKLRRALGLPAGGEDDAVGRSGNDGDEEEEEEEEDTANADTESRDTRASSIGASPRTSGLGLYARLSSKDAVEGARDESESAKIIRNLIPLHCPNDARQLSWRWVRSLGPQPLDLVQGYFGHARAFYFAFLGEYTWWLALPAGVGVLVHALQQRSERGLYSVVTVLHALFLALWATLFLEYWKRRQAALAFRWDAVDYEEGEEEERPEFRARASPVYTEATDSVRWVHSGYKKALFVTLSAVLCTSFSAVATLVTFYLLRLSHHATGEWHGPGWEGPWALAQHAPMAAYLGVVQLCTTANKHLASRLTMLECHRTETQHNNALLLKLVVLEFCNHFGWLFYIAFVEGDLHKLQSSVAFQLGAMQLINLLIEVGTPMTHAFFSTTGPRNPTAGTKQERQRQEAAESNGTRVGEKDVALSAESTLYEEYLKLWVQFGQVTLFSMIHPLAALFACLANMLEIRTDAFKMLHMQRRNIPMRASGIGSWLDIFEATGYIAVLTNVALVGMFFIRSELADEYLAGWSAEGRILLLVGVEHAIVLVKYMVATAVPDQSDEVAFLVRERRAAAERELNAEFEIKAKFQDLLRTDREVFTFRDTSDQGRRLVHKALSEDTAAERSLNESMLLRWILDEEDRRQRAEKLMRFYRTRNERYERQGQSRMNETAQFLNLAVAALGFVFLFTRDAREGFSH